MFRRRHRRATAEEATEVYRVRERLVDIGDDCWIETDQGRRVYKVDGKALRLRDTFVITAADGTEVVRMRKRPLRVRDTFAIERPGKPDATVRTALISPFRDRWTVAADDFSELKVEGNVVDHEYRFETEDGRTIGEASKRWFRIRDTYGVQIDPSADVPLILARRRPSVLPSPRRPP